MNDIKEQLIDVAQALIQTRGYNGFSYRDIADEVGIRSASIHYHFPTKADLGTAVAERYTDRFLERLEAARAETTDVPRLLSALVSMFREALLPDGRMCLCGMLGAEIASMPDPVAIEVKRFFSATLEWLTGVLSHRGETGGATTQEAPATEAAQLLATLEGAMIMAKSLGDPTVFDGIAAATLRRFR